MTLQQIFKDKNKVTFNPKMTTACNYGTYLVFQLEEH